MADWIKLHRALLADGLWQMLSQNQPKAFIGLLLSVNWQAAEFGCRNCHQTIRVPAGGTAKSIATLANESGVSHGCMKRLLGLLERKGFIISRSRPRCHSLHVIKNWDKYQGDDGGRDPGVDPVVAPGATPGAAPIEECKEGEEVVLQKSEGDLFGDETLPSKQEQALAERHRNLHLDVFPQCRLGIKTASGWARNRGRWEAAYKATRGEHPPADLERAQDVVYRQRAQWFGRQDKTWADVMDSSGLPPKSLIKNLHHILKADGAQQRDDTIRMPHATIPPPPDDYEKPPLKPGERPLD